MSEAWVRIPSNQDFYALRKQTSPDKRHPYDFGFFPAMGRLQMAHLRLGSKFGALFNEVMFAPGHLSRAEREMIAAVTAAAQDCRY